MDLLSQFVDIVVAFDTRVAQQNALLLNSLREQREIDLHTFPHKPGKYIHFELSSDFLNLRSSIAVHHFWSLSLSLWVSSLFIDLSLSQGTVLCVRSRPRHLGNSLEPGYLSADDARNTSSMFPL